MCLVVESPTPEYFLAMEPEISSPVFSEESLKFSEYTIRSALAILISMFISEHYFSISSAIDFLHRQPIQANPTSGSGTDSDKGTAGADDNNNDGDGDGDEG